MLGSAQRARGSPPPLTSPSSHRRRPRTYPDGAPLIVLPAVGADGVGGRVPYTGPGVLEVLGANTLPRSRRTSITRWPVPSLNSS